MPLSPIPGHAPNGATGNPLDPDRRLHVAVVFRASGLQLGAGLLAGLVRHLQAAGLATEEPDRTAGVLFASGAPAALERAFDLRLFADAHGYAPDREPSLPRELAAQIAAILGLTNRSRPMHLGRPFAPQGQGFEGFRPDEIAKAYGYAGLGAATAEQRAVLLEFGSGFRQSDVDLFCLEMGLPRLVPNVRRVARGVVDPGLQAVDMEATLDLQWLWAAAGGGCAVEFLEAPPGSSDASFAVYLADTLRLAGTLSPDVISISYGDGETQFPPAELQAVDLLIARLQAQGTDTFIASGDQGAYGMQSPGGPPIAQVDAPSCVPHAIAVGGTHLAINPDGSVEETGWTDTGGNGAGGGGFSRVFLAPAAEAPFLPAGTTGRGVPDIALDADPRTGYQVVFEQQLNVVGGTSAAAPVAAGAWLRVRALLGKVSLQSAIYTLPATAFRDILFGDNSYDGVQGYRCGPGWDAVTGRGAPDFAEIANLLR